jgi:hypothetical protein
MCRTKGAKAYKYERLIAVAQTKGEMITLEQFSCERDFWRYLSENYRTHDIIAELLDLESCTVKTRFKEYGLKTLYQTMWPRIMQRLKVKLQMQTDKDILEYLYNNLKMSQMLKYINDLTGEQPHGQTVRVVLRKLGIKMKPRGGNNRNGGNMPFEKGYKHPNITWRIDWQEIEAQAGRTIDDMYDEMQSCRLVGKSLAPYVGLLQGISGDCVRHELIRRGHKLRGRGGNNNPTGRKKSILDSGNRGRLRDDP